MTITLDCRDGRHRACAACNCHCHTDKEPTMDDRKADAAHHPAPPNHLVTAKPHWWGHKVEIWRGPQRVYVSYELTWQRDSFTVASRVVTRYFERKNR